MPANDDMGSPPQSRRAGGRRARAALRAGPPQHDPAPPGQRGGQYHPLSGDEIQAIHATALRILDEIGMGDVPPALAADMARLGCRMRDDRLLIGPEAVERAIALAPREFTLHGVDPARSIEVGGETVWFGTGGAAVQVVDLVSGRYRPSTLADLADLARLQDGLRNIAWFTRPVVATDLADIFELDVNTVFAMVTRTTKPLGTSFSLPDHVEPVVRMLDIVAGGPGAFACRPFLKAHISPVISPLKFGADAVETAYACARHGMVLNCIIGAQSGATGPATLAGFLAQSLAETLAELVMVQAISPGHPMIFSNWPFVVDLRTGAFTSGGPEVAVMNAAMGQIGRWLGLPTGVAAGMTDAKLPDTQWGAEKALTLLAAGLGGANMVYESAGMSASLMGASFEGMLIDDEIIHAVQRLMRGIDCTDEALAFEAVRDAVTGEGHFLGHATTRAAMERDYLYPALADRASPLQWQEAGGRSMRDSARERARELLAQPARPILGAAEERAIRRAFPIRLP